MSELKFRALKPNEVELRVGMVKKDGSGFSLLIYKDARVDMTLLDETVGADRWQRKHEIIDGNLYCSVGIKFGDEWVWKQDVGTESNTEKEKGQASDSFKRACFNWGIGRELYTGPFIWIKNDNVGGKYTMKQYDKYTVSRMDVVCGQITGIEVLDKNGKVAFTTYRQMAQAQTSPNAEALQAVLEEIDAAMNIESLAFIYNNHTEFHTNQEFMNALGARKSYIKSVA